MNGSLVNLNEMLLGDKIYDIPVYQRSYAWEQNNLEDLWEDLYYLDTSKNHYFGTVLIKDSGNTAQAALTTLKRFDVIDGQQRLTTILILLREIISQLREISGEDLKGDVTDLEKNYLRNGEHYKLNPLGDDYDFFHHVVIDGNEFLKSDTNTHSQRRLAQAKEFFREQLIKERKRQPSDYLEFLVQLKQKIDGLQLIQYQVESDADAIRIFETTNDRGRPLSSLEKTKSFLMHASYLGMEDPYSVAGRLQELNGHFSGIYRHFEDVSDTRHIEWLRADDIQRYHFINYISSGDASNRPLDSLKDRVREMLREDPGGCVQYALDYTRDLEHAFFAVKDFAEHYENDTKGSSLGKLFMLERMGNIFPLLMASWLRFGDHEKRMQKILELLETFIVRVYLVGGYRSHTGASSLNRLARRVHQGSKSYGDLVWELQNNFILYYQDDSSFESSLRWEGFYNYLTSRNIKYLLSEFEIELANTRGDVAVLPQTQENFLSSDYEVEHIWAQSPAGGLAESEVPEHQRDVHKLGNLTIALKSWNKQYGNKSFAEKRHSSDPCRPSYANSSLWVQKELAEQTEWNSDTIKAREDRIAKFALQRWNI